MSKFEKLEDWRKKRDSEVKLKPRTKNQENYVRAIEVGICTIVTGPAGVGKTMWACYKAFEMLQAERVKKIILTRPSVECGMSLGFQPGDLFAKMSPYARPMLEMLYEFGGREVIDRYIKAEIIEIVPLQFMRGRNFHNTFIIGDELQNSTFAQLKLLLTRVGQNSRLVMCGDIEQVDISERDYYRGKVPFVYIMDKLRRHINVECINMGTSDIQRSNFVKEVCELLE